MEILACVVTALVYLGTLAFGFVYDDVLQIFQSPALHGWRYLPQYFTSDVLAALHPGAGGNYYRPLLLLWLRLNYVLFGPEPAGWHAATVLCHLLATFLVFQVVERVTSDRMVAFTAALLFGVHPAHIESVAWISGVSDPLMSCFLLGSLLAFFAWRRSAKVATAVYSLVLFGLALLSKETAAVLPLLIFVAVLVESQPAGVLQPAMRRFGLAIRESAPYVLVVLFYLLVRSRALHGFSHPAISLSWARMFLTWPAVLWFYARHLLLPTGLSEFYSLNYRDHATGSGFWLPLALLAILLLAGWFSIRALFQGGAAQRSAAWFAVALIVLPLLPVLDLPSLTVGDIVHDRYLYLPSVGYVLLIALSLREIERHLPSFHTISFSLAGASLVALGFAVLAVTQQPQWANDIQLYTRGLESAPDNLTVRDNLANALLAANQPQRAIPMYLEVLQRSPGFWRSNYNLGLAYYKTGNSAGAEDYLEKAIKIDRGDSDEFIYLAVVELQLKKFPEAAENARQAIARNPQARGYHFILGLIGEAQGDRNAAIAAFMTEANEHPENTAAITELQKIEEAPASPRP
jgi:tetratricopeptide (TPR) repeat protein